MNRIIPLALSLLLFIINAWAMPPAPGLIERLRSEGRLDALVESQIDARARGMDAPHSFDPAQFRRDGSDEQTFHAICILVDFDDNVADTNVNSVEHFQQMLFSQGEYQTGSVRDWYLENSYGQCEIIGDVVGWFRMPHDYSYYVNGQRGMGNYPRNAQRLTQDAIAAADGSVDFSQFDNNGDGIVEALFVVHAGVGAEENGSNDQIWSHTWNVPGNVSADGVHFSSYAMEPENGRIGVFGHELGHALFGLPDLYDVNYNSAGIGNWSMMAGGSWGGGGDTPVHFDVWCKQHNGFISPIPVMENRPNDILEPIESEDDARMAWRYGDWGTEYFLLENRQPIGFDRSLPGSGLLIWHIDDQAADNAHPWWPGQVNGHNKVALEQADGLYNLEHNENGGDGGDPFPGSVWNDQFSTHSQPNSCDYAGHPTNVAIINIENSDTTRMRFDALLNGLPDQPEPNLFLFERVPRNHRFPDPDERGAADSLDEVEQLTNILHQAGIWINGHGDHLSPDIFNYNVIIYLESWRDEPDPGSGLSHEEQRDLSVFLERGGKLVLIGPDVAANLQADTTLWPYLHAIYEGEGEPREVGNIRHLTANAASRIAGQNFVYLQHGICDHYANLVSAGDGAQALFTDQSGAPRGVSYGGPTGYRVILQPFSFGGVVDWGGVKADLMRLYFNYMRFTNLSVTSNERHLKPERFILSGAYPNPFNGGVNIVWRGDSKGSAITIFDIAGRQVDRLTPSPGSGQINWTPVNLPGGSYLLMPEVAGASPLRVVHVK